MVSYAGMIAVITGGASGIGRALGEELANRGAVVILADIDIALAEHTAAEIAVRGGRALARKLDVVNEDTFRTLIEETFSQYGRLDFLFNNAGITVGGEAHELDKDAWDRVLGIDLLGVINGVRAAYPIMVKVGQGHIINISSLSGLIPSPFQAPYVTAKFGVVGLSLALRAEAHGHGVRVSVVCPGVIDTPILKTTPIVGLDRERVFQLFPKGMPPDVCARKILRAVEKNKGLIVVTALARLIWIVYRISPAFCVRIGVAAMKKIRGLKK
jgi:NAD(P)-dependent dehydrogenase (short-subunit alcohol dehydrogenase family)